MLLIFDLDGTLFKAKPVVLYAAEQFCQKMNVPLPQERHLYKNADTFLCAAVPDIISDEVRGYYDGILYDAVQRCGKLYHGVPAVLRALKNGGHTLLIASASGEGYIKLALAVTGISDYFSGIYSAEGYPSKAELISELITHGEKAAVIGDTHGDIEAARACGLKSVAATYGYGNKQMLGGADCFAGSPEEIVRCIQYIENEC